MSPKSAKVFHFLDTFMQICRIFSVPDSRHFGDHLADEVGTAAKCHAHEGHPGLICIKEHCNNLGIKRATIPLQNILFSENTHHLLLHRLPLIVPGSPASSASLLNESSGTMTICSAPKNCPMKEKVKRFKS
jgi:hypothetical protein